MVRVSRVARPRWKGLSEPEAEAVAKMAHSTIRRTCNVRNVRPHFMDITCVTRMEIVFFIERKENSTIMDKYLVGRQSRESLRGFSLPAGWKVFKGSVLYYQSGEVEPALCRTAFFVRVSCPNHRSLILGC